MRLVVLSAIALASVTEGADLGTDTRAAWMRYLTGTEERIARELDCGTGFLVEDFLPSEERAAAMSALHRGEVFVKKLRTVDETGSEIEVPGGTVHHWLGSIFVPGASLDEVLRFVQDYDAHARYFDEVERSRLLSRDGESYRVFFRLRRHKVVTVYYNTEHVVKYQRHGAGRASSSSHAIHIAEVENQGTPDEREKPPGDDRGFLWRLESYWRFDSVPGGVVVECESVSLSRSIPAAVRWLVGRYVDSIPRESLESTLLPIRREVLRAQGSNTTLVQLSSLRSKRR